MAREQVLTRDSNNVNHCEWRDADDVVTDALNNSSSDLTSEQRREVETLIDDWADEHLEDRIVAVGKLPTHDDLATAVDVLRAEFNAKLAAAAPAEASPLAVNLDARLTRLEQSAPAAALLRSDVAAQLYKVTDELRADLRRELYEVVEQLNPANTVKAIERRRKLAAALRVLTTTPGIRTYLEQHDPAALGQALAALGE